MSGPGGAPGAARAARDALGWALVIGVAAGAGFYLARPAPDDPREHVPPPPRVDRTPAPAPRLSLGLRLTQDDAGRVVIEEVLEGGHGEAAGLVAGETILAAAGEALGDFQPLFDRLAALRAGEALTLRVLGGDGERDVRVTFAGLGYEHGFARRLIGEGVAQLLAQRRARDGLWPHYQDPGRPSVAVSALVAYALARAGDELGADERAELERLRARLLERQGEDGGLNDPAQLVPHRTYATALLLLAFTEDGAEDEGEGERGGGAQADLARWLAGAQVREAAGYDPIDTRYGGWSYYDTYQSARLRTDVSTARYALQALAGAGPLLRADDPVWTGASLYLDLVQNHATVSRPGEPTHRQEQALRDGGFAFTPRMSKAGDVPLGDDILLGRSYGSATADGLLALLATRGVDLRRSAAAALAPEVRDDPSVLAALRWLARHYAIDRNPGFDRDPVGWGQGLYFYYLAALTEGLHRAGVWALVGEDAGRRVWAEEVVRRLGDLHGRRRAAFGSDSGLMHEDSPTIAAAFAVIALAAARDRLALGGGADVAAGAPPPGGPLVPDAPAPTPEDALGRGRLAFRELGCAACHADEQPLNAPSLVGIGDEYLGRLRSEARARERLAGHIRRPREVPGLLGGEYGAQMPAYGPELLADERLADLVSFLLSRSGDRPVSAAR